MDSNYKRNTQEKETKNEGKNHSSSPIPTREKISIFANIIVDKLIQQKYTKIVTNLGEGYEE